MNIVQKLIKDGELSSSIQLVVRDETGLYSTTNNKGYGGANGFPPSSFEKYIFELVNIYTNNKYRHVQSDDINNTAEYHNPTIAGIVNKDNVSISASTFNIVNFPDGLYKLYMNVQLNTVYNGIGNIGVSAISNISNAQFIYDNFRTIIIGSQIYKVQDIAANVLILDRPLVANSTTFKVCISTSINFIISDDLNDNIDCAIAKTLELCNPDNTKLINATSELQLYFWAMNRSIDENDIFQAYEYFKVATDLSNSLNY